MSPTQPPNPAPKQKPPVQEPPRINLEKAPGAKPEYPLASKSPKKKPANLVVKVIIGVIVGIILVVLAFGLVILAYIMLIGARAGLVLFAISWIRNSDDLQPQWNFCAGRERQQPWTKSRNF